MNPGPHGPEPCALPNCASPRLDVILSGRRTLTARGAKQRTRLASDSIGALRETLKAPRAKQRARLGCDSIEALVAISGLGSAYPMYVEVRMPPDLRRGSEFLSLLTRRGATRVAKRSTWRPSALLFPQWRRPSSRWPSRRRSVSRRRGFQPLQMHRPACV